MEKKEYEAPVVFQLGAVRDLTTLNKCGGSGDAAYPQVVGANLSSGGCTD